MNELKRMTEAVICELHIYNVQLANKATTHFKKIKAWESGLACQTLVITKILVQQNTCG